VIVQFPQLYIDFFHKTNTDQFLPVGPIVREEFQQHQIHPVDKIKLNPIMGAVF